MISGGRPFGWGGSVTRSSHRPRLANAAHPLRPGAPLRPSTLGGRCFAAPFCCHTISPISCQLSEGRRARYAPRIFSMRAVLSSPSPTFRPASEEQTWGRGADLLMEGMTGGEISGRGRHPLHEKLAGRASAAVAAAAEQADVLILCGDLTDYGLPEEAHVLARELSAVSVPGGGRSAITTSSPASSRPSPRFSVRAASRCWTATPATQCWLGWRQRIWRRLQHGARSVGRRRDQSVRPRGRRRGAKLESARPGCASSSGW
jgi:hypothetical protein